MPESRQVDAFFSPSFHMVTSVGTRLLWSSIDQSRADANIPLFCISLRMVWNSKQTYLMSPWSSLQILSGTVSAPDACLALRTDVSCLLRRCSTYRYSISV